MAVSLSLATLDSSAQTPSAANQVKAVFLYNFTQFISWPQASFTGSNSPFLIAVVGTNPFGSYLEKVVEGEQVAGHPIKLQYYADVKDVQACHMLYMSKGSPAALPKNLDGQGLLTVGEEENFTKEGGIIRFYLVNNKIRFQINAGNAKVANINISSKLLRLADVIGDEL